MPTSPQPGYYRFPTVCADTVVFACEDDLWTVPAAGGVARRLTSGLGQAAHPALAPDGEWLAFTGRDEGQPEVYVMPAAGGPVRRLTYMGAEARVVGWGPDGRSILFSSNAGQPFLGSLQLFRLDRDGGEPATLPTGPAVSVSYASGADLTTSATAWARPAVIARNTTDIARWKRYRGGLTGDMWIDALGDGQWRRLVELPGNVAMPLWVGGRIYFVSDHEGIGNLYSCLPTGSDLRRHTHRADYYVRHPATDGKRIVFHAGGDLFLFDADTDVTAQIEVAFHSPRVQLGRKFVPASQYVQGHSLHPKGRALALTVRGKPFTMANWEGAVTQHGVPNGVRYRLSTWLADGKRLAVISDQHGEEALEVHTVDQRAEPVRADRNAEPVRLDRSAELVRLDDLAGLGSAGLGRAVQMVASPKKNEVAISNHRHELIWVDLDNRAARVLDRSRYARILGVAWSPDGRWLAYGIRDTRQTSLIKLCRLDTGETVPVTRPVLHDLGPAFDPGGKYLYFLSFRDFNPVYDSLHFDLSFPRGMRPYLLTLQAELPSPFIPVAPSDEDEDEKDKGKGDKDKERDDDKDENKEKDDDKSEVEDKDHDESRPDDGGHEAGTDTHKKGVDDKPIRIDLEGIADRVLAFPVPEGTYGQIRGIKDKALFTSFPIEGALGTPPRTRGMAADGKIEVYDFKEHTTETLVERVTHFEVSQNGKLLLYRSGNRLRVLKAGEKPPANGESNTQKSGWIDLGRIRVSVSPPAEWEQMYREGWRLQRDQFWSEDMSGVDWQAVYLRYYPLIGRVATRAEFSDLMWEMQGELGTSHAYEFGGDYRTAPSYAVGQLGADFRYDPATDSFVLTHIARGDPWDEAASSPLARAGAGVRIGDRLVAVGGRRVGKTTSPGELLVNQAEVEVQLTFETRRGAGSDTQPGADPDAGNSAPAEGASAEPVRRTITVKTLTTDRLARYRDWVDGNRGRVHQVTGGRVGYLHIPDMGANGYAEFHRGFLAEVDRMGLIVDVRFNGGGHVSELLLEKLARRRIGYDVQRWGEPTPYPNEAVMGPMVALTNERAGSDGDMFSHAFKLMKLGPLLGKRTWGGVIGISPRDTLVDGGLTTQPEFSFWFKDVGWGLENYGTDPDFVVEYRPQDYVAGLDPQLDAGIAAIEAQLAADQPHLPEFGARPRLLLPGVPG